MIPLRIRRLVVSIIAALLLFLGSPATQGQGVYTTIKNRGLMEKANGNLKGAIADFTNVIKLKPDDPEAYNNRGLAEYAKGDLKAAIADFSKAIELKPDYGEVYSNRAAAEYAKGDFYGSRKDEAKATDLKNGSIVGPVSSSPVPTGINQPLPDISFATCPTSQPAFARGDVYRAYSGCALPRDQVAILNLKGTHVRFVDGISAYNIPRQGKEKREYYLENSDSLELLPGRHTIQFVLFENGTHLGDLAVEHLPDPHNVPEVNVEGHIDVEAGKTYTAIWRTQDTGNTTRSDFNLQNAIADRPKGLNLSKAKQTTVDKQFWVEIAEFRNDPATYLQLYDVNLKNGDPAAALSALESYLVLFPKDPNHKAMEDMARKLRASLNKAQLDAYRNENSGPSGPTAKQAQAAIPKIRGCKPEQFGQPQPQERTATPLQLKGASNRQAPPDLDLVLSRATRYVEEYEAQLGNLIGEEVYVQNIAPVHATTFVTMFPGGVTKQQRTESDFAILQVGKEWVGLRDVNCVDGKPVQRKAGDFQKILDDSPTANRKTIDNILRENGRYNIGLIQRNTNLPTFALQILRTSDVQRFEFKKTGETLIGGVRTWAMGFQELAGPTLIHDGDNNEEFANGTLWIEPETGRILKTEVNDAGRQGEVRFRAQTIVSYKNDPRLEMLVPIRMVEHYDTDGSRKLDCQADYFNFHRFQVDTHFDFGPPIPPDDGPSVPSTIPAPVRPIGPPPAIIKSLQEIL